ncbi:unnamed protein product [Sympodiomycopsis kandeliae]
MPLLDQLQRSLEQRKEKGMLRNLTIHQPSTLSQKSTLVDLSSNDYLSIATSEELKAHFMRRASEGRIGGSTGSRLLDGNNGIGEMEKLEARLCSFFQAEVGLLCPSGWEANVSLFSTVPQKEDFILYDELIHASVHDGIRKSRAKHLAFRHNDVEHFHQQLHQVLKTLPAHGNVFLSVESLYSMDGDTAPLNELINIARRYFPPGSGRFWTLVDEAHSGGCFGPNGAGLTVQWGLASSPEIIRVMTFGKGFGGSGAIILCPSIMRHYLINYARPLIFSTALPHSALLLIHSSLDVLESPSGEQRRQRLHANSQLFQRELISTLAQSPHFKQLPDGLLSIQDDPEDFSSNRAVCNAAKATRTDSNASFGSPILPLLTPHHWTRPLALYLQSKGFLVRPITYPTVPMGKDRIRICIHSDNDVSQIQSFAKAIAQWLEEKQRLLDPSSPPHTLSTQSSPTSNIATLQLSQRSSRL